jgi:hypothetical protein
LQQGKCFGNGLRAEPLAPQTASDLRGRAIALVQIAVSGPQGKFDLRAGKYLSPHRRLFNVHGKLRPLAL